MKSSSWVIVLVVLVLVLLAATVYQKTKDDNSLTETSSVTEPLGNLPENAAPSVVENEPETITVTYTDNGFSPATVTIQEGDTVEFVNKSGGKMWVASAPHPTHTNYPGFDQKSSIDSGGRFLFMFNNTGAWAYHNHSRATDKGTVVVQ